jgi:hypothetical protein
MSTHRRTWQKREQAAAGLFGAKRKVLSGSSGRDDETSSDSTHPTLFIETKLRAASAARSLWEQTRALARREGKTPVVLLYAKGKPGALIVVHQDDLAVVAAEFAAGRDLTDERKVNGGDNPAGSTCTD